MVRREDWKKLRRHVRRLGVRLVVLTPERFHQEYDSDIRSLYDPPNNKIVMNGSSFSDEDVALYSLAHELGHVIDHLSEPHHSREYAFHYHLMAVYHRFNRELPDYFKMIFQEREDMANGLALSLLEELQIPISTDALEACIHH